MFKKNFVLNTIAMGGLSLALALGSSACSSSGGGSGSGNGLADSVLASSQGAETENTLLTLADGTILNGTASIEFKTAVSNENDAAAAYATAVGSCATVDPLNVVTIDLSTPCTNDGLSQFTSGTITVTFEDTDDSVTFVTDPEDVLTTEAGVTMEINSSATFSGGTWTVTSDSVVTFGGATSTTSGEYTIAVDDPCSTINGDVVVELDTPELADLPVSPTFAGTYTDYSVCNDGTCPDGEFEIGLEGVYTITATFDGTTTASITISAPAGGVDETVTSTLQCTPRE